MILFRAEARTRAPPIPGPRGEGVSPRCRAHSARALPAFCITNCQSQHPKGIPNYQQSASQVSWKVWTSHLFYPIKVLGLVPPGLNQVEPVPLGAKC
jgi:hypothetical protein